MLAFGMCGCAYRSTCTYSTMASVFALMRPRLAGLRAAQPLRGAALRSCILPQARRMSVPADPGHGEARATRVKAPIPRMPNKTPGVHCGIREHGSALVRVFDAPEQPRASQLVGYAHGQVAREGFAAGALACGRSSGARARHVWRPLGEWRGASLLTRSTRSGARLM